MFTGLIKEIGTVTRVTQNKEGRLIEYSAPKLIGDINIDDSVSVNGACQTVVAIRGDRFHAQAVAATLEKSTLGRLVNGEQVNLELALRLSDRLGGHLVAGHINDMGTITRIKNLGENYLLSVQFPQSLAPYFIAEGSVTLDGISLTIAELKQNEIIVSVIPHTWQHTTLKNAQIGKKINIEVDLVAKYIERMLLMGRNKKDVIERDLDINWIKSQGFN